MAVTGQRSAPSTTASAQLTHFTAGAQRDRLAVKQQHGGRAAQPERPSWNATADARSVGRRLMEAVRAVHACAFGVAVTRWEQPDFGVFSALASGLAARESNMAPSPDRDSKPVFTEVKADRPCRDAHLQPLRRNP